MSPGHLHTHPHPHADAGPDAEEMQAVETAFIAGFREAPDKQAFLRLSGIPLSLERPGATSLKLIEVKLADGYRVGSASPGFASRELSYQPLPAALVSQSTELIFRYVSTDAVVEKTLRDIWRRRD